MLLADYGELACGGWMEWSVLMLKLFQIGCNVLTLDAPTLRTDSHTWKTAGPNVLLDVLKWFQIEDATTVSHGQGSQNVLRLFKSVSARSFCQRSVQLTQS